MKKPAISLLLFLTALSLAFFTFSKTGGRSPLLASPSPKAGATRASVNPNTKIQNKSREARSFASKNGYSTRYCFLIDMSLPSGENRFFVVDLKKDSIIASGLVTHGRCNEDWLEGRKFGNTIGCGCTSLGKYRVGHAYQGKFGLAFKLYGLEKTNDNAYRRFVVLHAHPCVPDTKVKEDICQSDGCPTVSPPFLRTLQPLIKGSGGPLLLWIFD